MSLLTAFPYPPKRGLFLAVGLTLFTLAGCSHIPAPAVVEQTDLTEPQRAKLTAHQQQLAQWTDWQMEARGAIRDGDQGGSFSMQWQQADQHADVMLSGPFGQGRIMLSGTPEQMQIGERGQPQHYTTEPQEWLKEHTGWAIPIAALPDWLLGKLDPRLSEKNAINVDPAIGVDENGYLTAQTVDQWQIRYDRYDQQHDPALPGLIEITRDDLRLRILIDEWRMTATDQ